MTDEVTSFPLMWPAGWKRAARRERARFSQKTGAIWPVSTAGLLTVAQGRDRVLAELRRMCVKDADVVISTNMPARNDGLPRSGGRAPDDPGVAVYWSRRGQPQCMAIDRYDRVPDNLAAVAATLDALRAIERHGGAAILDRAFTGFTALPPPEAVDDPYEILGVQRGATEADIQRCYRILAARYHPDRTDGDHTMMTKLNRARDALLG